eukprot:5322753-Amphidinium_carterae.1
MLLASNCPILKIALLLSNSLRSIDHKSVSCRANLVRGGLLLDQGGYLTQGTCGHGSFLSVPAVMYSVRKSLVGESKGAN